MTLERGSKVQTQPFIVEDSELSEDTVQLCMGLYYGPAIFFPNNE